MRKEGEYPDVEVPVVQAPDDLNSKIQLHLSCRNLPRMDLLSKSDPFVVIYKKEADDKQWREIQRTETIWNNEDPEFPDHIVMKFKFEAVQKLRFEVYDRDTKSSILSEQDYIGSFETTVSRIMGSRSNTLRAILLNERKKLSKPGELIVRGKEIEADLNYLYFTFSAENVDRKNWWGFGRSDPFYEIYQRQDDDKFLKVFTGEKILSDLSPNWRAQNVSLQRICNSDTKCELKIVVFDWESSGSHQYIGEFVTCVDELLKVSKFDIINKTKQSYSKYTNSGVFIVNDILIKRRHSFLEFIQGGLELSLMVAIDFTASNGDPRDRRSLHHLRRRASLSRTGVTDEVLVLNEYQKAILSVGQILEDYDTDKKIPAFGFGAIYKGQRSHCFPLNFDDNNPDVDRVEGLLDAYSAAVSKLTLSGPTLFGPILNEAVEAAQESVKKDEHNYHVLLILTDGIINDMNKSIERICEGASLPLSIIIAGVGDADFSNMDTLDGDEERLTFRGKAAERDIVQFVPMRDFKNKSYTALAEATLEELPGQVTSYFANRDIKPRTPVEGSKRQLELIKQSTRRLENVIPMAEEVPET